MVSEELPVTKELSVTKELYVTYKRLFISALPGSLSTTCSGTDRKTL